MKKNLFIFNILISSIVFSQNISMPSFAQGQIKEDQGAVYNYYVTKEQSDEANQLNIFLANYLNALKTHDIQKISNCYASNFVSGDGFNKDQIIDLIKQSWEKFPDLKYSTSIKNLRFEDNRASIEFSENITATTKEKSEITKDTGSLTGKSQDILYLEKYGSGWKIVTDRTLYEETEIKYGIAKDIDVNLDAPEQVLSGENYTASLKVDLPPNVFALGSVTSAPIIYPAKKPEETFKQIPDGLNALERIIKTNKDCLNEISSATVSFCEAERTAYTGFDLKVSGLAVVLKRVNTIPKK